jgi:hypothetical protein
MAHYQTVINVLSMSMFQILRSEHRDLSPVGLRLQRRREHRVRLRLHVSILCLLDIETAFV